MLPKVATSTYLPNCAQPRTNTPTQPATTQVSVSETYTTSTRVEVRGSASGPALGGTSGVEAYQAVQGTDDTVNPFAKTILTFIDAQLRRDVADGASAEELKSRLEAGLRGFEEGYGDAFKQLSASGLLSDDILSEIEGTRSQVLAGIQKLADELGVEIDIPKAETPVATTPTAVDLPQPAVQVPTVNPGKDILSAVLRDIEIIEQYQKATRSETTYQHLGRARASNNQSYAYGVQENRNFSLKLRTADGDLVTIGLSAARSGQAQFSFDASGNASLVRQGSESSGMQFAVEGELDEGELRALSDLLQQVGDISERFFQGDLESAFQLATKLSFDNSEIASFDMNWNMSTTEVAGVAQQSERPAAELSAPAPFEGFVESVKRAGDLAEQLGQPRSLVADLLDWVTSQQQQQDARSALLAPMARAVL
jgi:hypothetical protein